MEMTLNPVTSLRERAYICLRLLELRDIFYMIQGPLLSICIPTMNRRPDLERTLASLLTRDQNNSFQVIVSDNCSADETDNF